MSIEFGNHANHMIYIDETLDKPADKMQAYGLAAIADAIRYYADTLADVNRHRDQMMAALAQGKPRRPQ